jgi:plastocyanin
VVVRLGVALALMGGLTLTAGPVQAAPPPVVIVAFTYEPSPVSVARGQAVTWVNLDTAPHTASYPVGCVRKCKWTTPAFGLGGSSAVTIKLRPGTYSYYCKVHPFMVAKLTVTS